jgi:hypothetical protein
LLFLFLNFAFFSFIRYIKNIKVVGVSKLILQSVNAPSVVRYSYQIQNGERNKMVCGEKKRNGFAKIKGRKKRFRKHLISKNVHFFKGKRKNRK